MLSPSKTHFRNRNRVIRKWRRGLCLRRTAETWGISEHGAKLQNASPRSKDDRSIFKFGYNQKVDRYRGKSR